MKIDKEYTRKKKNKRVNFFEKFNIVSCLCWFRILLSVRMQIIVNYKPQFDKSFQNLSDIWYP